MELPQKKPAGAYTLVEHLVVVGVLAVLAMIFLPTLARHRATHCRISCFNNQKVIGLAFRTWALDNNDHYPMQVSVANGGTMDLVASGFVFPHFRVMSNELSTPRVLICPWEAPSARVTADTFARDASTANDGQRLVPFIGDQNVSYFVGVDATDSRPSMFLCGDRNLAFDGVPARRGLHSVPTNSAAVWVRRADYSVGGICLADGSVHPANDWRLQQLLHETGITTNRLAFP